MLRVRSGARMRMERGSMFMSKTKKILMMLAKGGASQSDIAATLRVSK